MLSVAIALAVLGLSSAQVICTSDSDCTAVDSHLKCCAFKQLSSQSTCYDTRYEKCCANTACKNYAACCNTSCCGAHSQCKTQQTLEADYDTCTRIEKYDVIREYTSIGVPIVLGFFAIVAYAYAFVMFIMHRVRFTMPLVLVIVASAWCWIWAILLLISQFSLAAFFLCGVSTAAIAALAAIAPAHAPTQVICTTLVAVGIAFLMMINPLASNSLFSFSPMYQNDVWGGVLGRALTGLSVESFQAMNTDTGANGGMNSCVGWYNGYWRRDPALYLDTRIHDPIVTAETWGLCGRKYQFYIAVIATFETAGLPLLFLALVARLWEVRGASADPKVAPEAGVVHKPIEA